MFLHHHAPHLNVFASMIQPNFCWKPICLHTRPKIHRTVATAIKVCYHPQMPMNPSMSNWSPLDKLMMTINVPNFIWTLCMVFSSPHCKTSPFYYAMGINTMNAFTKLSTLYTNALLTQMACNHDFSVIWVFLLYSLHSGISLCFCNC